MPISSPFRLQPDIDAGAERLERQADASAWAERLAQAHPHAIIEAAARALPGRLAVVSSFGTESAALLKFVADVDPSLPVLFLDTLWLFKETLSYRDTLVARLKLSDVRSIAPSPSTLALRDPRNNLCFRDRDACCGIRKVAPLERELEGFDGWISGRKRYHGGERAALPVVEADGARLKFNPLARLPRPLCHAIRWKPWDSRLLAACRAPAGRLPAPVHAPDAGVVSPRPNAASTADCLHRPASSNARNMRWIAAREALPLQQPPVKTLPGFHYAADAWNISSSSSSTASRSVRSTV